MNHREDLLRPTLGETRSRGVPLHSATTGFVASFFGGPIAGVAVALVNSWRLHRFRQDWPLLPGALLVEGLLQLWLAGHGTVVLEAALGAVGPVLLTRTVGLLFFACIYTLHKRYYRGMQMLGLGAANGIVVGLLSIGTGIAVRVAIQALIPR